MPTLTKRHFEQIAQALGEFDASDGMIEHFCQLCRAANPQFSRERFVAAIAQYKVKISCVDSTPPDPSS